MSGMDVDLEIHSPGLDLHHRRWNYHVLFMDEVHDAYDRIAAFGWQSYLDVGRGTIFVNRDHWMTVISAKWSPSEMLFPCTFIAAGEATADGKLGPLRAGFRELIEKYDPETQFVLTVEHHSADLLSCYLMRSDPGPKEAHESTVEIG